MIESMTGFGSSSLISNRFTIEVEVKSINSRFLDLSVRLPRGLNDKEIEIRNLIKQYVNRGKVSLNIFLKKDGVENGIPSYDSKSLKGISELLRNIKKESGLSQDIQISDILSFYNVLFSDSSEYSDEEYELTIKAIKESLEKLKAMRIEEGKQLVADLQNRIDIIDNTVDKISVIAKNSVDEYFNKVIGIVPGMRRLLVSSLNPKKRFGKFKKISYIANPIKGVYRLDYTFLDENKYKKAVTVR